MKKLEAYVDKKKFDFNSTMMSPVNKGFSPRSFDMTTAGQTLNHMINTEELPHQVSNIFIFYPFRTS